MFIFHKIHATARKVKKKLEKTNLIYKLIYAIFIT